jgi:divalent metal cation (Fe/Co/Zn/Cd) transporter
VSQVVIANAYHHRTDALSSVVALVGIGGAMMGYGWLDSFAGLVCGWDYHGCLLALRHGPE